MKNLLLSQLGQEIAAEESFEMGYFQGNKRVRVRNEDESCKTFEVKGQLLCDSVVLGKSQASKRVSELSDSESDGIKIQVQTKKTVFKIY